jgi:hypothetical protein
MLEFVWRGARLNREEGMSKIELWIVAPLLGFACWLGTGTDASPQNSKASEASQRCLIDLKNLNFQAGIDDCTRAIALNPKDEQSLELRCEAHANLGDFPAALPDCTQARCAWRSARRQRCLSSLQPQPWRVY